jgi:hypothetical protein
VVKDIVDNSVGQRESERRERLQDLSLSPSKNAKAHGQRLRRLQKSEDIKQLFMKLKVLRTTHHRQGVTRIEIPLHPGDDPKACQEWQQVEVPTEVLYELQKEIVHTSVKRTDLLSQ